MITALENKIREFSMSTIKGIILVLTAVSSMNMFVGFMSLSSGVGGAFNGVLSDLYYERTMSIWQLMKMAGEAREYTGYLGEYGETLDICYICLILFIIAMVVSIVLAIRSCMIWEGSQSVWLTVMNSISFSVAIYIMIYLANEAGEMVLYPSLGNFITWILSIALWRVWNIGGEVAEARAKEEKIINNQKKHVNIYGGSSIPKASTGNQYHETMRQDIRQCMLCNSPLREGDLFCPKCGVEIEKKLFCPNCHSENAGTSKFCRRCGTRLQE